MGNRRGILLAYPHLRADPYRAPEAGQSDFKQYVYPACGRKVAGELKAAEFSKNLKAAVKTQGYVTITRSSTDTALTITKGHIFKTRPDASGTELKYYAMEDILIPAGTKTGKVLVEAEKASTMCQKIRSRSA